MRVCFVCRVQERSLQHPMHSFVSCPICLGYLLMLRGNQVALSLSVWRHKQGAGAPAPSAHVWQHG